MVEVHPLYTALQAITVTLGCILFVLYALQIYRDRKKVFDWQEFKKFKTHRLFRVSGFIGVITYIIVCTDYYGALGILPPEARSVLGALVILTWWTCLWIAGYHSVSATLVFLPLTDRDRTAWWVRAGCTFFCLIVFVSVVGALIFDTAWVFQTAMLVTLAGALFVITLVNFVYFTLRGHHKHMQQSEMTVSSTSADSLDKIVRQWRNYSIFVTLIMIALSAAVISGFSSSVRNDDEDEGYAARNAAPAADEPPTASRFILPIVYFLVYTVMLWRSWRTADEAESGKSTTARGKHTEMVSAESVNSNRANKSAANTRVDSRTDKESMLEEDGDLESGEGEKNGKHTSNGDVAVAAAEDSVASTASESGDDDNGDEETASESGDDDNGDEETASDNEADAASKSAKQTEAVAV